LLDHPVTSAVKVFTAIVIDLRVARHWIFWNYGLIELSLKLRIMSKFTEQHFDCDSEGGTEEDEPKNNLQETVSHKVKTEKNAHVSNRIKHMNSVGKEHPFSLTLTIHSAKGLPIADITSSDPYCFVLADDKIVGRTKTIVSNLNPEWEEEFFIPLMHTQVRKPLSKKCLYVEILEGYILYLIYRTYLSQC